MISDMTSLNLNKEKFVADCIAEYKASDEYDITIVFDEYFDKIIDVPEVAGSLSSTELSDLHNELYLMVEKELVIDYESEAETDDDNS
jgi:hypothetical protein